MRSFCATVYILYSLYNVTNLWYLNEALNTTMIFELLFNIILTNFTSFDFQGYFRTYSKGLKLNWLHPASLCVIE